MNIDAIERACRDIAESARALDWLTLVGDGVNIPFTKDIRVRVDFQNIERSASAERVIEARVKAMLPDLIEQSIKDCHDAVERSYAVLQQELSPPRTPHPEGAAQ